MTGSRNNTEVHLEIRELIFYPDPAVYILDITYIYIYFQVSAINRSSIDRSITNWKLLVRTGSAESSAEYVTVDTRLVIERASGTALASTEPIRRPTWNELADEGLRPGTPRTAWVAFALQLPTRRGTAPHNAEFILTATDSMGSEHTVIREPQMYVTTGKLIKDAASRVPVA